MASGMGGGHHSAQWGVEMFQGCMELKATSPTPEERARLYTVKMRGEENFFKVTFNIDLTYYFD